MAIAAKTLRVKVDDRRVAAIKLGGKRLHPIGGFGRNRRPCGDDADFDLLSVHSSVAIPASKKAVAEPQDAPIARKPVPSFPDHALGLPYEPEQLLFLLRHRRQRDEIGRAS